MFSIRKAGKVSTVETSTEVDSTSSSDESTSFKRKTFSILRSTKNCVMRQCRARRRGSSEGPPPAPPRHLGCCRGILRHNALSALAAKLEAAASEASEASKRPRTRCLIGRVPRRGVGVALTVRRPHKTTDEDEDEYTEGDEDRNSSEQEEEEEEWHEGSFTSTTESVYSVLPVPTRMKKTYIKKHNRFTEELSCDPCKPIGTAENSIAFHWAEALKRLDRKQKQIAKKAINDVLLEAQLGNLSKYSVQINTPLVVIPSSSDTPFPTSCSSYVQVMSPRCSHTSLLSLPSSSSFASHTSLLPSSSSSLCKHSTSCPICSHSTILFRPAACCQKTHPPCRLSHTSLLPLPAPCPLPSQPVTSRKTPCFCEPAPECPHLPTPIIPEPAPTSSNTSIKIPEKAPTCTIPFSPCHSCSLLPVESPPSSCECAIMVDKQLSAPSLTCFSPPCAPARYGNGVKFSPSSFTCPSRIHEISPSPSSTPPISPTCSQTSLNYPPESCLCPSKPCEHSHGRKMASSPPCSLHTLINFPSPTCSCSSFTQEQPISCSHTLAKLSPVPSPCPSKECLRPLPSPTCINSPPPCKQTLVSLSPIPSPVLIIVSPAQSPTSSSSSPTSPSPLIRPNNSASSPIPRSSPVFSPLDEHIRKVLRFPEIDASSEFRLNIKQHCHAPTTKDYLQRFNRFIFRGLHYPGRR